MSVMTKRQQARNERALQELIKTVPGNDRCADCQAWSPGWASWSLGIFLCVRCASLHRKLGTHITKVKSLSMDSWSNEQVDVMRKTGNVASNRIYNPQNAKPPIPLDIDEADSTMERFLRQKYDSKILQGKGLRAPAIHSTGSSSSEDPPPPLPPKPSYRLGLGSRSSSAQSLPRSQVHSPRLGPGPMSPASSYKFDNISGSTGESFESKMATLRDMGFQDSKKNATVLKGLSGNLERAIESLIRLSGSGPPSRSRTPVPSPNPNDQKALPRPKESPTKSKTAPLMAPAASTNPFNQPQKLPPTPDTAGQLSPSYPTHAGQQPYSTAPPIAQTNPFNPFGITTAGPIVPLEQSMGNLTVSQPLFPNATGGLPQHQTPLAPYQPILTPPPPGPSSQFGFSPSSIYAAADTNNHNPFFTHLAPSSQPQQIQMDPSSIFSFPSQPQQNQSSIPQSNSFIPAQMQPQSYIPQSSPVAPVQPPPRPDKSAIMALFNQPHLAPSPMQQAPPQQEEGEEEVKAEVEPKSTLEVAALHASRSVSMPVGPAAGSRNPFAASTAVEVAPSKAATSRHISQESVDLNGFASGRTSPDAFTHLSARYVR